MLLVLAIILAIAWVSGVAVVHLNSVFIHALLVLALLSAFLHLTRVRAPR